jgi:hypothetical protein
MGTVRPNVFSTSRAMSSAAQECLHLARNVQMACAGVASCHAERLGGMAVGTAAASEGDGDWQASVGVQTAGLSLIGSCEA